MTWDEMVETAARAMWAEMNAMSWENANTHQPGFAEDARDKARTALLALREAGVRFAPAKVSDEMFRLGDETSYLDMLAAGEIKPEDGK